MRLFEDSVRGHTVIAADGQPVGQVTDLALDSNAWRVESLHLKLNNDMADQLGVERGKFHAGTLDLPVHMVQSVGDTIILSVPSGELRRALLGSSDAAAAGQV